MYAGRKVEEAPVGELFAHPRHPYTRGLLDSIPKLGAAGNGDGGRVRLAEIAGTVPSLSEPIVGCAFAPRCAFATPRCRDEFPPLEEKAPAHFAACWESARVTASSVAASTQSPEQRRAAERPDPNDPDDHSPGTGRDASDARAAR
jgi:peptide/nickel transport system ATP-binding protein